MTLCRQKVTTQGKNNVRVLKIIIKNSVFAIFTRNKNLSSRNWYHKATAPVSTVLLHNVPYLYAVYYIYICYKKTFFLGNM